MIKRNQVKDSKEKLWQNMRSKGDCREKAISLKRRHNDNNNNTD